MYDVAVTHRPHNTIVRFTIFFCPSRRPIHSINFVFLIYHVRCNECNECINCFFRCTLSYTFLHKRGVPIRYNPLGFIDCCALKIATQLNNNNWIGPQVGPKQIEHLMNIDIFFSLRRMCRSENFERNAEGELMLKIHFENEWTIEIAVNCFFLKFYNKL